MEEDEAFRKPSAATGRQTTEGSSVRKTVLTAVSMALIAAPAALAQRGGHDPAAGSTPAVTATPAPAPVVLAPCGKAPSGRRVEFILRGVVASVSGPNVMVQATGVNSKMRNALQGPTARGGGSYDAMIPVTIADCTRLHVRGHSQKNRGKKVRAIRAIVVGARIMVEWRAPRGTAFADLGSPKRVWVK